MTISIIRSPKSSILSIQIFVLYLVGWFGVLFKKFVIFWYPIIILLYQYRDYQYFFCFFWRYYISSKTQVGIFQNFWTFQGPSILYIKRTENQFTFWKLMLTGTYPSCKVTIYTYSQVLIFTMWQNTWTRFFVYFKQA